MRIISYVKIIIPANKILIKPAEYVRPETQGGILKSYLISHIFVYLAIFVNVSIAKAPRSYVRLLIIYPRSEMGFN